MIRNVTEIDKLAAAKKWAKARALILDELLSAPTDHWLWTTLGLTFYEQRRYEKALPCSQRAVGTDSGAAAKRAARP